MKLSDKTALVTGAANGIGRAIAVLFAAEGASVVLVDKDEPHARETADAIIAAGGRAAVCVCDVSRQEGVDAAYKAVMKPAEGPILTVARLSAAKAGQAAQENSYFEFVHEAAVEEARVALERLYAAAEALSAQMREKDVEADRLRFESQSREAAAAELESAIAVLKNNVQNNLDNAQRIRADLDQQEGRADSLAGQIGQRQERLAEIEDKLTRMREELRGKSEQAQEAAQSAGTLARELEELRQKEAMETATAAEAKALLSALAAAAQEVLDRDETVRQELRELDSRLEEGRAAQRQARKALAKAVEERDAVQNVISGYALRLESRRKKAEQARERHMKLQMDENALSSRLKMLTQMEKLHEGYSKAVKLVMGEAQRGSLQHIHGPVADLLKVPEEYTVAIETALGGAMQHIVVDTEEAGMAGVGRFVVGLLDDIRIIDSPELTDYLRNYLRQHALR